MNVRALHFSLLTVAIASILIVGCGSAEYSALPDTSPKEYRSRLSHVHVTIADLESDVTAEVEFGKEVGARILGTYRPLNDPELNRYVNLVGRSVALHASRPELEFRFQVLDSDTINAFAAPGGYIFITTGALQMMSDEAQLAAVLAHEIAHVTEKHIVNELGIRGVDDSPVTGLSRLLGAGSDPIRVAFAQAVDQAVDILFTYGLKQEDEFEADYIGTLLLAQTGYEATAMLRYLESIAEIKGEALEVIDRTHPAMDARFSALREIIDLYDLAELDNPIMKERFESHVKIIRN
ncbi:peptidase M48 Ste24p [Desulfurispirillum indicum S5]|uniref:Peptidase M48 Ste24p n=1 Tax=Desulfurispirillum indicum (strain ATCC BAA-1389 / DSM 22839 / S5) TaxID=653733 RepID=E6W533_DESIS|nr:M48 family metalloprotease [Desulfurispirillum indicum]ADU66009.1 peptidase M48 Ste24p [Desulfurispirillum indicum S5]